MLFFQRYYLIQCCLQFVRCVLAETHKSTMWRAFEHERPSTRMPNDKTKCTEWMEDTQRD